MKVKDVIKAIQIPKHLKTFLENPHSNITATKFLLTLIRSMQTLLLICSRHYRRS